MSVSALTALNHPAHLLAHLDDCSFVVRTRNELLCNSQVINRDHLFEPRLLSNNYQLWIRVCHVELYSLLM